MHQTNMYRPGSNQPTAAAVDIYDLKQIAPQFAGWNFQIGQPYDQHTPQIAMMTIEEIQQQALGGHAIRVGAFHILSDNAFNNAAFQDLVYTIIMRMGHGIQNQEWRNLDIAAGTTIARAVKACASSMAAQDPEFMGQLAPREAAAVRENTEVWAYLVALAQGQAQYIPFSQMSAGESLSSVAGSTQEAMAAARNLRGSTAGAFVESHDYAIAPSRHNNNASPAAGRYGRRAEKIYGKVEGSMQQALQENNIVEKVKEVSNYQGRMRRPSATGSASSNATVAKFDKEVTDFTKPMETTTTTEVAAAEPEPVKAIFIVKIGDDVVELVRQRKEGFEAWKQSKFQRFHPAWCKRTHRVLYFESKQGPVIAVLQPFTTEEKEIAMNYEAHAIDPTKGRPEPEAPVRPVREEAKALYATPDQVVVNIVTASKFGMEEDTSGAIRSTRHAAEMSEPVPDAYIKSAIVNSPVVYQHPADATEDYVVLKAIGGAKDFAEAAEYMPNIRNVLARKLVNDVLVEAVNRATVCELGVKLRISNFEEDGAQILTALETNYGSLVSEKMRAHQTALLQANVRVVSAMSARSYADATLSPQDHDELSDAMAQRISILQRNVCTVWVNFTDDELAIGVPPKGPAAIQADSLAVLLKIAQTVFEEAIGQLAFSEQFLITKDNVRYRLHRGLLNKECYLLSK